ncbi:MAG: hypothetical protein AAGD14_07560 [Planctomycetota bacterium]
MIIERLEDLNLHDSTLLGVAGDFERGEKVVDLIVDYVESYEPFLSSRKRIRFRDCAWVCFGAAFAATTPQHIQWGETHESSFELTRVLQHWPGARELGLRHHAILLHDATSKLEVICPTVELLAP